MAHGDFNHIEFPADDLSRARGFYEALFGWQFSEVPGFGNYYVYRTPGGLGGGLGKRGETAAETTRNYVAVERIADALPQVESLGGTVVTGRTEVAGQG